MPNDPPPLQVLTPDDPDALDAMRRALEAHLQGRRPAIVRLETDHGPILLLPGADAQAHRIDAGQEGPVHAPLPRRFQLLDDAATDVLADGVYFPPELWGKEAAVVRWRGVEAPLATYASVAEAEAVALGGGYAVVTIWIDV